MKRLLCLLLSSLLVLPLASCGSRQTDPPSSASSSSSSSSGDSSEQPPVELLPFSMAYYPSASLHPTLTQNKANQTLGTLLFEPLFQLDTAFQPVPVLCQSYTASPDNLTWSFTLRSGVTFSNGTALTGAVVAEAINLARQAGSLYAQRLQHITAVTAADTTVTVTLSQPNGNLPALLDFPIALGSGSRPVGTGPYVLSGEGDGTALTARSDWWQGKALPMEEILLTYVPQGEDLISSFASGGSTLVDVDLMGTDTLGYSGNYTAWDYPTTDFLFVGFNTQRGICQDAAVRQALSRGIDREAIVQGDYARHAVSTALPVHPASPLYDEELAKALAYDPQSAKDTIYQYQDNGRSVTMIVNSENSAKVAASKRIVDQLAGIGISVKLAKLSFADYTAALAAGNYDLYMGEVILTADFNLTALLSPSGSLNYGNRQDWAVDPLLIAMTSAAGELRTTAAQELFKHLNAQVPLAPIAFKTNSALTQWGRVSGMTPVRGNVFYQLENWTLQ